MRGFFDSVKVSAAATMALVGVTGVAVAQQGYVPAFNDAGELLLPKDEVWREWMYVARLSRRTR